MAKLYVGTYAKYNAGNLAGAWIDLDEFAGDKDGFYARIAELHKDEHDPEFMFQDFEDFPREFYGESSLDDALWDWLELDEDDRELLAAWTEVGAGGPYTIEDAQEHFQGIHDSERDFAQSFAEDIGAIQANVEWPYSCIDWDHAARELMMDYSSVHRDAGLYIFRD